jgi:hypothetical protein
MGLNMKLYITVGLCRVYSSFSSINEKQTFLPTESLFLHVGGVIVIPSASRNTDSVCKMLIHCSPPLANTIESDQLINLWIDYRTTDIVMCIWHTRKEIKDLISKLFKSNVQILVSQIELKKNNIFYRSKHRITSTKFHIMGCIKVREEIVKAIKLWKGYLDCFSKEIAFPIWWRASCFPIFYQAEMPITIISKSNLYFNLLIGIFFSISEKHS